MIKSILFNLIAGLSISNAVVAQPYDSIKICHTQEGYLKSVRLGDYSLNFLNQRLHSFSYKDGLISFDGKINRIEFNSTAAPHFSIESRDSGLLVKSTFFNGVISTPQSLGHKNAKNGRSEIILAIDSFHMIALFFEESQLKKLSFPFEGLHIAINRQYFYYSADVPLDFLSEGKSGSLQVSFLHNHPQLINLEDSSIGIGINISYNTKDNMDYIYRSRLLEGHFAFDEKQTIKYNKKGILCRKTFPVDNGCQ